MPPRPISRTGAFVAGGVGIGAGNRRHQPRKLLRDNIKGITKPTIRRLARRAGVVRIKSDIYETTRNVIKEYLEEILRRIVAVMSCAGPGRGSEAINGRKVVQVRDVAYVLRQMGRTIYGFDV